MFALCKFQGSLQTRGSLKEKKTPQEEEVKSRKCKQQLDEQFYSIFLKDLLEMHPQKHWQY